MNKKEFQFMEYSNCYFYCLGSNGNEVTNLCKKKLDSKTKLITFLTWLQLLVGNQYPHPMLKDRCFLLWPIYKNI